MNFKHFCRLYFPYPTRFLREQLFKIISVNSGACSISRIKGCYLETLPDSSKTSRDLLIGTLKAANVYQAYSKSTCWRKVSS